MKELKDLDNREPIGELKRLAEANPSLGFAFRTLVDHMKEGTITPEVAAARIRAALEKK